MSSEFRTLSTDKQKSILEALIFASEEPLTIAGIEKIIAEAEIPLNGNVVKSTPGAVIDGEIISQYVHEINEDLRVNNRPYRIVNVAGGFQFATTGEFGEYVQRMLKSKSRKRLSQAALETLAIIAYRQPMSKPEIEAIRGVNSSEVVNALLEKELIQIAGRAETPGRPLLYSTTLEFLRIFGLKSHNDLPKLRELDEMVERRGIEESEQTAETTLSQI